MRHTPLRPLLQITNLVAEVAQITGIIKKQLAVYIYTFICTDTFKNCVIYWHQVYKIHLVKIKFKKKIPRRLTIVQNVDTISF